MPTLPLVFYGAHLDRILLKRRSGTRPSEQQQFPARNPTLSLPTPEIAFPGFPHIEIPQRLRHYLCRPETTEGAGAGSPTAERICNFESGAAVPMPTLPVLTATEPSVTVLSEAASWASFGVGYGAVCWCDVAYSRSIARKAPLHRLALALSFPRCFSWMCFQWGTRS